MQVSGCSRSKVYIRPLDCSGVVAEEGSAIEKFRPQGLRKLLRGLTV